MSSQWIEESCPMCHCRQLFDNGDIDDLTAFDIESLECYSCGHKWPIDEDADFDPEFCEVGIPVPVRKAKP